jgi:hypothetical protein
MTSNILGGTEARRVNDRNTVPVRMAKLDGSRATLGAHVGGKMLTS